MADFCKQCLEGLFGDDSRDLAGLSTPEDSVLGRYPVALCEGCGPTQVDHEGTCIQHHEHDRYHLRIWIREDNAWHTICQTSNDPHVFTRTEAKQYIQSLVPMYGRDHSKWQLIYIGGNHEQN